MADPRDYCLRSLGLIFLAALCSAQHIQFGSLVNGTPVARAAVDSAGNLYVLETSLALGLCCGVGARLVTLLTRYGRDGSSRILQDTGFIQNEAVLLAVDSQDRAYAGVTRDGAAALVRFGEIGNRERRELFVPFTRLAGIAFAPNGDPIVVGTANQSIQVARLTASTLNVAAQRVLSSSGGDARAIAVDAAGAVYVAGSAPARGFQATPMLVTSFAGSRPILIKYVT
jgi:hypothetical protein